MQGEDQSHQHQYAFGNGGRMCVASQLAARALYTVFLHLVAYFELLPAEESRDPYAADPLKVSLRRRIRE